MRKYAFFLILIGTLVALSSWSLLCGIALVQDAFATGQLLGWITLMSMLMVAFGVGYLCYMEFAGYYSMRCVDKLACVLRSDDLENARRRGLRWLFTIASDHCVDQQLDEVRSAQSVADIRQSISTIVCLIDAKVDRMIAKESVLIGAAVGISPWAFLDGVIVAWRQLRLMRTIATRYGARPGALGTIRLLRQVLVSVVFADVSEHAMQWVATKIPSLGGLIPSAGQAVAIIVMSVRLGRACKATCRPVAKSSASPSPAMNRVRNAISETFQHCKRSASD